MDVPAVSVIRPAARIYGFVDLPVNSCRQSDKDNRINSAKKADEDRIFHCSTEQPNRSPFQRLDRVPPADASGSKLVLF